MTTNEIKNSVRMAVHELRMAEDELNRPVEDMVTLSACLSARHSMNSFLKLYLKSQDVTNTEGLSMYSLLNQCRQIDPDFETVSFTNIFCSDLSHKECESKYCLASQNVSNCIAEANRLKMLVLNKLELKESEVS